MNKKDSNKHIETQEVIVIAAIGMASSAIVGLLGYRAGYVTAYFKGAQAGADIFANNIVEKCPEAAEILIKAGAIVKR